VRPGFGWESLAASSTTGELWTANEEALTVDGPQSSPTAGTAVRLVRYQASGDTFLPAEQFAYNVDPWHGLQILGARGGLVELVQLPDRRLIALERSLAFGSSLFQNRIYEIGLAGATDVSSVASLSSADNVTPVTKTLLYSGSPAGASGMNMEGLALGPALAGGGRALVGIVDDGDPISVNTLVTFSLAGTGTLPQTIGDLNDDGAVDRADAAVLLRQLGVPSDAIYSDGDLDGDGNVSLRDEAILANHLGAGIPAGSPDEAPAAGVTEVPEPGTISILIAALSLLGVQWWLSRRWTSTK
jgi:hypothetical protein